MLSFLPTVYFYILLLATVIKFAITQELLHVYMMENSKIISFEAFAVQMQLHNLVEAWLTKLMGYFMEDDGYHCTDSERETLRNGRSESKTIGKVVDGITKNYHPGKRLDFVQTASTTTTIIFLYE